MTLDLTKLSPAPFEVRQDPVEVGCKAVCHKFEYEPREFATVWIAREMKEADAVFLALARQAFTIMLKRGWGVEKCYHGWSVYDHQGDFFFPGDKDSWPQDPFTAVVKADRWLTENKKLL